MRKIEQINRIACFPYRGHRNVRYTAQKHPLPANPFVRHSVPVSIQIPPTMEPIAASAPVPVAASSIGGVPVSSAMERTSVNPSMDIVAGAIMAMEPEQVDRVERAAAQQAAVILQSLV